MSKPETCLTCAHEYVCGTWGAASDLINKSSPSHLGHGTAHALSFFLAPRCGFYQRLEPGETSAPRRCNNDWHVTADPVFDKHRCPSCDGREKRVCLK